MAAPLTKSDKQLSRAEWLEDQFLTVDGVPFSLQGYPWIVKLLNEPAPETTIVKGGQLGWTSACVFDAAFRAIEENLRGILYLFPTDHDVNDFSRARWSPNVSESPFFQAYCSPGNDTVGLKQIKQTAIYFRAGGAIGSSTTHSLSKLKSIPVDHLVEDEADEMQPSRLDAAEKRLDGSRAAGFSPRIIRLSTPTMLGYGVDYEYQELSDQSAWYWKCERCGGWSCLELEWPHCLADPQGKPAFYRCSKCKERLRRSEGDWIAAKPDRSERHRGFWVSQLSKRSADDVLDALKVSEKRGRPREFHNQTLARAYAELEDRLTEASINDCLGKEPMLLSSEGPCCAGADPGSKWIHYWIKLRVGDEDTRTVRYGRCDSFEELSQISRKFKVQVGCIDIGAEKHAVRRFLQSNPQWWGIDYGHERKAQADWDAKTQLVSVGRNYALDASHYKILHRREELPAPSEDHYELLVPQLRNMARIRKEDGQTGEVWYEWVVLGGQKNDHLKHAHAYATIAEKRVGLALEVERARVKHRPHRSQPRSFMSA